jgi:hypothetical protein
MRALTLTQPFATLVASGAKRIETRSWKTSYRGPLAIHAAKGFPKAAREVCGHDPFRTALELAGVRFRGQPVRHWYHSPYPYWLVGGLPLGAIVAVATLEYVFLTGDTLNYRNRSRTMRGPYGLIYEMTPQEIAFGDYSPGRFGWVLARVKQLPAPIPCCGALGLWTVPLAVEEQMT